MLKNISVVRIKVAVFILLSLPFANLVYRTINGSLGGDPQKELVHETGSWALYILFATLCMTPLRRLTAQAIFIRLRRMFGLFSFFYLCLHLTIFIALYMGFEWGAITEEIVERPYIVLGMVAFIFMFLLAVTSNQYSMRCLGARWHKLHRLVYVIAILGVWHFTWQVKSDLNKPILFISLLCLLFGLRIYWAFSSGNRVLNKQ